MATTTNYGWTTPDDTALVKDGAAAIRTLGTSIDTTTKALNPSTTLGDIEYRSSTANTNTRLGIGTTGQLLTVSGGVPAWTTPAGGGGMTLINTGGTSLSGSSVTISSIPDTYNYLQLFVLGFKSNTDNFGVGLRINADSNTSRYYTQTAISAENASYSPDATSWSTTAGGDNTTSNSILKVEIYGYANTTTWKMGQSSHLQNYHGNAANINQAFRQHAYNQTGAITSITLIETAGGSFNAGTAYLYGVK
jgi:hypothetical protein